MKRIKLQVYFIVIAFFNFLFRLTFFWTVRKMLLLLVGCKIGKGSCVQKVRFLGLGKLTVGNNTTINSGCYLDTRRGITIKDNVIIAHDTKIYTLGHEINDLTFKTKGKPVTIEDYVIVFSNVLIMPGVTIGRGAVILPGSVITKNVEPMAIMGGNPAAIVRERQTLHLQKESYRYWFSI